LAKEIGRSPIDKVRQLQPDPALYDEAVASRRFAAVLVSVFAGAGLALVAIGLFGVMSYLVGLRTKEIASDWPSFTAERRA
jgi:hypothetical protein